MMGGMKVKTWKLRWGGHTKTKHVLKTLNKKS